MSHRVVYLQYIYKYQDFPRREIYAKLFMSQLHLWLFKIVFINRLLTFYMGRSPQLPRLRPRHDRDRVLLLLSGRFNIIYNNNNNN